MNVYLFPPSIFTVRLLALFFLMSLVYADISLTADTEVVAYDSWEIRAYVSGVSFPTCHITITSGGVVLDEDMLTTSDYAFISTSFGETGDYTATVECDGEQATLEFSVVGNSRLEVELGGVPGIGESLQISAIYTDLSGSPIYLGSCEARIYVDGELLGTTELYNTGEVYTGWWTITKSGDHSVKVTCYGSGYTEASRTKSFTVEKQPVTVELSPTSLSGKFGDTKKAMVTVFPTTASCESSLGTLQELSPGYYSLSVNLNFVGKKSAVISCSAQDYLSSSKTVEISSREKKTTLTASLSTQNPFSFQKFQVTPNYYDAYWNPVKGASCTVELEGESHKTSSFGPVWVRAPPGPRRAELKIACSKYGYTSASGSVILQVQPIVLSGNAKHPDSSKVGEETRIELNLYPPIKANCSLEAELLSLTGAPLQSFKEEAEMNGTGGFAIIPEEVGTLKFVVTCNSGGYTEFNSSGEILISTLSREEETQATIALTILTVILAVGFVLVRRWI